MADSEWERLTRHYAKMLMPEGWSITVVADPFSPGGDPANIAIATTDSTKRVVKIEYDANCTPNAQTVVHELLHSLTHNMRALFHNVTQAFVEPDKGIEFTKLMWEREEETLVEWLSTCLAEALPKPIPEFSPRDCHATDD